MLSGYPPLSVPSRPDSAAIFSATAGWWLRVHCRYGFLAARASLPQLLLERSCPGGEIAGFYDGANDDHAGGTGGERVVGPAEGNAADGEPQARRSLVRDVFHLTPRLFGFLADLVREIEPPGRPAPATLNGSRKLSK